MDALSITDLAKTYANGMQALKGISLHVAEGDFFGLLGPNGAGKTTTIGIMTGLVNKTSGTVEIFGRNIDREFSHVKKEIGVVPQEFNFSIFEKVMDVLVTQAGYYGVPRKIALRRAEEYLKELGLWEKRDEMSKNLSGGYKRRLMIARSLMHQPRLLILDEPTAGVDVELRRSMWKFLTSLNKKGTTIILTTHYLEEAENLCKNIAIISKGQIAISTSKKNLLQRLDIETFVFDLRHAISAKSLDRPDFRIIDETTIEVDVPKSKSVNEVFSYLTARGIEVVSLRNKTNRLEELFMEMTR